MSTVLFAAIFKVCCCRLSKACVFIIIWTHASLFPLSGAAAKASPPSILVREQSDVRGPFYAEMLSAHRSRVNEPKTPVTLDVENLDLSRFSGPEYDRGLQDLFRIKYRDRPISVIVALGTGALDRAFKWHSDLWHGPPTVFAFVGETAVDLTRPPVVTGKAPRMRLQAMVTATRAVVPGLKQERVIVSGDPVQLRQVVLNLVINTIEAMRQIPGGENRIIGRTAPAQGGLAEITISDTGHGIPADQRKKVLEPFFSSKAQDMGMGLSIACAIVETHGGSMSVESKTCGGAVFRVRRPLIGSQPEASR